MAMSLTETLRKIPFGALSALLFVSAGAGCASAPDVSRGVSGADFVPVSAVEWGPLNPARGDASPRAGTRFPRSVQGRFLVSDPHSQRDISRGRD